MSKGDRLREVGDLVDCTLVVRQRNQGQFSVIDIEGGDIAAFNVGNISSYSEGVSLRD